MVPAAAIAGALLAGGCGGGGDDDSPDTGESTTTPETLTKEDYIARGDDICAQGTFEIGQRGQERFSPGQQPSAGQIEAFGQEVVAPTLEDQVKELRALPPPQGDAKTVGEIYDAVQRGIDELKADPALFSDRRLGGAFDQANQLAQAYGFKQCGQD